MDINNNNIGGPASMFAFGPPFMNNNAAPRQQLMFNPAMMNFQFPPQFPPQYHQPQRHPHQPHQMHLAPLPPTQQPRQSLGDTADGKHQANTSINIFRSFIHRKQDGELDATGVTSHDCYMLWLNSRKSKPSCPEKAFQRALSGHITGVDGRVPFDQEEEEAILRAVRRKARWECFRHCDIKFGESGFRTKGFHEKAYAGEILKTHPKKRAKRAMEKIRSISRSMEQKARQEEATEEEEADSSSNESSMTSPSSSSGSSQRLRKKPSRDLSGASLVEQSSSTPARYPRRTSTSQNADAKFSERSDSPDSSESSTVLYPHSVDESSAAALMMNIPTIVADPMSPAASTLLGMLVNMVLSLSALGLPYAKIVLALHRTIQFSRGWFAGPNMQKAEALMEKLKQKYPDDYIMLCDFSQEPVNRYLLQNDLSVKMFGKISRQHGGFKGIRVSAKEIWSVLKLYSDAATLPPGKEAHKEMKLYVRSEERVCEVFVSMDDDAGVIIERGRLADGPLRRQKEVGTTGDKSTISSSSSSAAPGHLIAPAEERS